MKITTFLKSSVILYFLMLYTGESLSVPVTLDWQVQLPSYNTEFIAADDKIFANDGKTLSAICAAGGQTEKTFELPVECVRNLKANLSYFWAINSGRIVYLDKDGFLSVFQADTFSVVRRERILENISGVTIDELIFSGNHIGIAVEKNGGIEILLYDLLTGEKKWALHEIDSKPVRRAAIEKDNLLVFTDLVLFVFNIKDKKLLWQADFRISHPDFIRFATAGNLYLIKEGTTSIKAFKRETGELAWMHLLSYCSGFVADEKTLYVSSNKKVFAMDAETGSIRWERLMEHNISYSASLHLSDNLLVGGTESCMFILDKKTGEPVQFYNTYKKQVMVSTEAFYIFFDRTLCSFSGKGTDSAPPRIYRIEPSDGGLLPHGKCITISAVDKESGIASGSVYAEINGTAADCFFHSADTAGGVRISIQSKTGLAAGKHHGRICFADYHGNTAEQTFAFTTETFPEIEFYDVPAHTFRGSPSHSGFTPEKFEMPYYARAFISVPENRTLTPVFSGKYVFVHRTIYKENVATSYIEQIDTETFKVKNRFQGGYGFTVVGDNIVYNSSHGGMAVHDIRKDRQIWRGGLPSITPPVIANGTIFIVASDANLYAFDLKTGKRLWRFMTNYNIIPGNPAIYGNNVFIGGSNSTDPYVYCIDSLTGEEKWRFPDSAEDVNRVYGFTERTQTPSYTQSNLVVSDDILFVTLGSTIYAIFIETGRILWSFPTKMNISNRHAPAVKDGIVYYVLNRRKAVSAFEEKTGKIIWEKIMDDTLERHEYLNDSPIIAEKDLLVATDKGNLFTIDCQTGDVIETIKLRPASYMTYINGDLWISSTDGLYVFSSRCPESLVAGATKLTASEGSELYPAFSPDGEEIAYTVLGKNGADIYKINLRTNKKTRLTRRGFNYAPVFSPDGKQIAYLSNLADTTEIFVMSAAGRNRRRITSSGGNTGLPVWLSDTKLAFVSDEGGHPKMYGKDIETKETLIVNLPYDVSYGTKELKDIWNLRTTPEKRDLFFLYTQGIGFKKEPVVAEKTDFKAVHIKHGISFRISHTLKNLAPVSEYPYALFTEVFDDTEITWFYSLEDNIARAVFHGERISHLAVSSDGRKIVYSKYSGNRWNIYIAAVHNFRKFASARLQGWKDAIDK